MSNQNITTHKFVIVLNKKIEISKLMNAIGHMSLGIVVDASPKEKENMGFFHYIDKDNNSYPSLSKNSYIVLRADNSNQIRTLRSLVIEHGIRYVDFTKIMQEGTYLEQIEKMKTTSEAEQEYCGICLFGNISIISELTRKFDLWK